jgi:hypothetical protein
MTNRHWKGWQLSGIATVMLLTGCLSPRLDNGERMIAHPQFEAATLAAPDWVREALDTIAELEVEIERGN